jgi:hypothetical protein
MKLRIHHFGLLVGDIEKFLRQSIWELRGPIVSDPIQVARLCMVAPIEDTEAALVELIQPLDPTSPTWRAACSGQGWHHVCLQVASKQAGDQYIVERRLLPVTDWRPALLFEGRAIRFAYSRNRELMEFLSDEVVS